MTHVVFRPALALALLTPALALAQTGQYTIQGQLGRKLPASKAYLVTPQAQGQPPRVDSADVKDGRFTLKGNTDAPKQGVLFVARPGQSYGIYKTKRLPTQRLSLYLEPGTVRVLSPDSLANATLSGTSLNADWDKLSKITRATTAQMDAVLKEWQDAPAEKKKDKTYEAAIDQRYDEAEAAKRVLLREFIQAHPNSLVSLDALKGFAGNIIDPATVGPLFDGLSPAVRQTPAGQEYTTHIEAARRTAVGAMAPEFTQNDANGKPVKLSDFRGKYVLVDFWASWCGPCRRENPNVVANYDKYKSRNFTVLGVSLDQPTGRDKWLKAIADDNLAWTQVSDLKFWKNEVAVLYNIRSIPQNLLIGPDGRIVAKNLRGDELGEKLAAMLPTGGAQ